jgi:tripartite-type tricarboxylate transporter receptor subunit TctC
MRSHQAVNTHPLIGEGSLMTGDSLPVAGRTSEEIAARCGPCLPGARLVLPEAIAATAAFLAADAPLHLTGHRLVVDGGDINNQPDSLLTTSTEISMQLAKYLLIGLAAATATITTTAQAQTYPTKPIRWVAPFAPGGTTDIVARAVAQKLSANLGQQVVIENRPGAGGNIAADLVVRSPADGYTLLTAFPGLAINPSLYSKMTYDPQKDLMPVTQLTYAPLAMVVSPSVPMKTVQEVLQAARDKPGTLNFCSAGNGTSSHLGGELFKSMAAIDIVHIPYRSSNDCINDIVGGRITMMINPLPEMLPLIRAGKLRGVAISSLKPMANVPDMPPISASGVPGYETSTWNGVMVPAGTPTAIVERLNRELIAVLRSPDIVKQFEDQSLVIVGSSPAEFATFIRNEAAKWSEVIRKAGVRIQ